MRWPLVGLMAFLIATQGQSAAAQDGAATYNQICVACHQAGAVGAPGLAPSLLGAITAKAGEAALRSYLAQVVTHGLQGRIVSEGQTYNSVMPAQSHLSDEALAAVLTHVVQDLAHHADAPAFKVEELAQARAQTLSAKDIRANREAALGR